MVQFRSILSVSAALIASLLAGPAGGAGPAAAAADDPADGAGGAAASAADPATAAGPVAASADDPAAAEAQRAMRAYDLALPEVRAFVADAAVRVAADRFLAEADKEFSLARLYAYTGQWGSCAQAARVAKSRLDDAVVAARRAAEQERALEVALDDLSATLSRAEAALGRADFDPLTSSTLAIAEQRRMQVAELAASGRLNAARWAASDAQELALLAIEQAEEAAGAYLLVKDAAAVGAEPGPAL